MSCVLRSQFNRIQFNDRGCLCTCVFVVVVVPAKFHLQLNWLNYSSIFYAIGQKRAFRISNVQYKCVSRAHSIASLFRLEIPFLVDLYQFFCCYFLFDSLICLVFCFHFHLWCLLCKFQSVAGHWRLVMFIIICICSEKTTLFFALSEIFRDLKKNRQCYVMIFKWNHHTAKTHTQMHQKREQIRLESQMSWLTEQWRHNHLNQCILWTMVLVTAVFIALYTRRLVFCLFAGTTSWETKRKEMPTQTQMQWQSWVLNWDGWVFSPSSRTFVSRTPNEMASFWLQITINRYRNWHARISRVSLCKWIGMKLRKSKSNLIKPIKSNASNVDSSTN